MSDLSRLRARLVRIEKRGKALKAELAAERDDLDLFGGELTRARERRIMRLEEDITDQRKAWAETWQRIREEERRLLDNPVGFLRFT